ncbi:MAG TPA: hypothetical protein VN231_01100 [Allosphingosinicella sp.]|nr:hypothetical protein [Allosphingosinicella sp.]
MKEALTLVMLALLVVPLLVGVRRLRRLPRPERPRASRDAVDGDARDELDRG